MNLNKVIIIGRVVKKPDIKTTNDKKIKVANFSVATNITHKSQSTGEKKEHVEYHNVAIFGVMVDVIEKHLEKGQIVAIDGRLSTQKWERDGKKYSKTIVLANYIQFGPKAGETRSKQAPKEVADEINLDDIPF